MKSSLLSVLKSNIKCAICEKKDCKVRYQPKRKKIQYVNGTRYIMKCEKDQRSYEEKLFKRIFR